MKFSQVFVNFALNACLLGLSGHPPPLVVDSGESLAQATDRLEWLLGHEQLRAGPDGRSPVFRVVSEKDGGLSLMKTTRTPFQIGA